ncbi:MAG: lactate utilization protein [Deltaproteobacteria bacterium]|nr:lactate utilization protein [Deltaproteobacteria bacterium]
MRIKGTLSDNTYQRWYLERLGERSVKALRNHDFDAHFFPSAKDAVDFIIKSVSAYQSFGFGGSVTTRTLGLVEKLGAIGKTVFDHWKEDLSGEEDLELRLEQGRCDCFMCSANAISATGEIINIDGAGNRTNAMTFGTRKVIIVAGMNKVVSDLDSALKRAMEVAAPIRAKSLGMETPCAETGRCSNCSSPMRICRITTILHRRPIMTDITVVLINETLGY